MSRKNIFLIGASHGGPEDTLTEMLAYLWQEQPSLVAAWLATLSLECAGLGGWRIETQRVDPVAGRFDLWLQVPDTACIIVESKLGSDLGTDQVRRYVRHLAGRPEPTKTLVTLTERAVAWPAEIDDLAALGGVELRQARWRDFRMAILDTDNGGLASEFAEMLVDKGLVRPMALTAFDWAAWNSGAGVLSTLSTLLEDAAAGIELLHDGLRRGRTNYNERWVYRKFAAPAINLHVGFSANESATRPATAPIIWADLENPILVGQEGQAIAQQGREATGAKALWGFQDAYLWKPVADVITAGSWDEQVGQVVRFAYEAASRLHGAGFVSQEVVFHPPSQPGEDPI